MVALKDRALAMSKHAQTTLQQQDEPPPPEPAEDRQDFDLEKAMDEVMARFASTLDYLAR